MCDKSGGIDVKDWTIEHVNEWLKAINYSHYSNLFKQQSINGRALLLLNETDIKDLIKTIGDRKNIYFHIKNLQHNHHKSYLNNNGNGSLITNGEIKNNFDNDNDECDYYLTDNNNNRTNNSYQLCELCLNKTSDSHNNDDVTSNGHENGRLYKSGDGFRTTLSVVYCFLTCLWTSFVLTVVHDQVPDMQKYPPLPDLILDNVPLMPRAFYFTEAIGIILAVLMLIIVLMHKHRSIVLRRLFALSGTIFLLRSVTMLITSLSVPGVHIKCSAERYGSLLNKLKGAWNILTGFGLALEGVRTCGDYMFSGHTVWLTLLTHFICEYTPYTMHWLHTTTWIMNIFGLFFILAAHEHYSIDVFVAFYITSRLFLYYHSLSNNKVLFQRDHRRVKIWFPLFSYFESNIHSEVPNTYENPIKIIERFVKRFKSKLVNNSKNNNNNKKLTKNNNKTE